MDNSTVYVSLFMRLYLDISVIFTWGSVKTVIVSSIHCKLIIPGVTLDVESKTFRRYMVDVSIDVLLIRLKTLYYNQSISQSILPTQSP